MTTRVQFLQMSMISARLRDLETRLDRREASSQERLQRPKSTVGNGIAGIHQIDQRVSQGAALDGEAISATESSSIGAAE